MSAPNNAELKKSDVAVKGPLDDAVMPPTAAAAKKGAKAPANTLNAVAQLAEITPPAKGGGGASKKQIVEKRNDTNSESEDMDEDSDDDGNVYDPLVLALGKTHDDLLKSATRGKRKTCGDDDYDVQKLSKKKLIYLKALQTKIKAKHEDAFNVFGDHMTDLKILLKELNDNTTKNSKDVSSAVVEFMETVIKPLIANKNDIALMNIKVEGKKIDLATHLSKIFEATGALLLAPRKTTRLSEQLVKVSTAVNNAELRDLQLKAKASMDKLLERQSKNTKTVLMIGNDDRKKLKANDEDDDDEDV